MSEDLPAPPGVAELLVSRVAPHMVLAASPAFLRSANYAEADVVGRSATILVGEGSCLVTMGAMWSALQVGHRKRP